MGTASINPSIALQGNPVPQSDILGQAGKVLQLKNLLAQQPLVAEELKTKQLENKQRQIGIAGQEAQNEAYSKAVTVGPDGFPTIDKGVITSTLAAKGQGHLIPSVLKQFSDMEESAGKVREQKSKLSSEEADYAGSIGAAAKAAGYDPDVLKAGLTHAAQIYGPQSPSAQALQQFGQNPQSAQAIADHLIAGSPKQTTLANEGTTAAARKLTADTGAAKLPGELENLAATVTEKKNQIGQQQFVQAISALTANPPKSSDDFKSYLDQLPHGVANRILQAVPAETYDPAKSPALLRRAGMNPEQQTTADQAAANAARAAATAADEARHRKVEEGQGAQRLGIEGANLNVRRAEVDPYGQFGLNPRPIAAPPTGSDGQPAHGEEFLKTLPLALQNQVRQMAVGAIAAPSGRAATSGIGAQIRGALLQYDPDFNEQRAQLRKQFTGNKTIMANNTAVQHLDQLGEGLEALKNGSFTPGNTAYNYFANLFGSAPPTNAKALIAAASGEMATALKGNATDQEIKTLKDAISTSASHEQGRGVVKTGMELLHTKLNTAQEEYARVNPGDKVYSPILPSTAAAFSKHGVGGAQGSAPIAEGTIIKNPSTGERQQLKGGKWVPLP